MVTAFRVVATRVRASPGGRGVLRFGRGTSAASSLAQARTSQGPTRRRRYQTVARSRGRGAQLVRNRFNAPPNEEAVADPRVVERKWGEPFPVAPGDPLIAASRWTRPPYGPLPTLPASTRRKRAGPSRIPKATERTWDDAVPQWVSSPPPRSPRDMTFPAALHWQLSPSGPLRDSPPVRGLCSPEGTETRSQHGDRRGFRWAVPLV
jgi:hypothetical protein